MVVHILFESVSAAAAAAAATAFIVKIATSTAPKLWKSFPTHLSFDTKKLHRIESRGRYPESFHVSGKKGYFSVKMDQIVLSIEFVMKHTLSISFLSISCLYFCHLIFDCKASFSRRKLCFLQYSVPLGSTGWVLSILLCSCTVNAINTALSTNTAMSNILRKKSIENSLKKIWKRLDSNPGLLGVRQFCFLCAMQRPNLSEVWARFWARILVYEEIFKLLWLLDISTGIRGANMTGLKMLIKPI